ncbi:hypothetical protein CEC48_26740 [Pseudomonas sp. K2I15]|nr:hypothetical protein CEC48_26740 [Pseudomonas sp. K2I15]
MFYGIFAAHLVGAPLFFAWRKPSRLQGGLSLMEIKCGAGLSAMAADQLPMYWRTHGYCSLSLCALLGWLTEYISVIQVTAT